MFVDFVWHPTRPWGCTGPLSSDCFPDFCQGGLFGVELSGGCRWCNKLFAGGQIFLPPVVAVSVTEVLADFFYRAYKGPTSALAVV